MKSTLVTIATIASINYPIPATLDELCALVSTDKEKAEAQILNAANQYYLQQNRVRVTNKVAEKLTKQFEIHQKLYVGKVEVQTITETDGTVTGYKAVEGKKTFKADEKVTKETAKDFIARVVTEKALTPEAIHAIVQKVATANGFSAEQKRVRGSVASKPVGTKWTKLAQKIVDAGNAVAAATKLSAELGVVVDVTGSDAVKRLALALSDKARKARDAEEAEAATYAAGTEETPLVVDGTKA